MYQLNYSRDDIHLVGKDTIMNAPVQAIHVPDTPEKHNNFTMIPNVLIDGFDELSDAARFAFIGYLEFLSKVGYFAGSIRKLGKKLKVANMTINRMVAAWEKFSLVRVEPIDDIDAVRVIPLTDLLWQTNTDHYQYAPAEVREPVTICDTISTTDTSETDRVVTKRDSLSQNVTPPVTNCDTVSQPQAQNDPQYLYKNIGNNKRKNISLTDVSDDAPRSPYKDGYQRQDLVAMTSLLGDLFEETNARFPDIPPSLPLTPAQEAKLYTMPVEMVCISDNETPSHIVKATGNEAAPPQEQPHAVQDRFTAASLPISATSPPTRETRKRGVGKNGLSLQGQHILDEY